MMFDPTAFENMKVVIEGALYDRDLSGDICILDRNDMINMAKLSRTYEVTFCNANEENVQCKFVLTAYLENLAAELLPSSHSTQLSGTHLFIIFTAEHPFQIEIDELIDRELKNIWGNERSIKQKVHLNPLEENETISKEITIGFNRLVCEEQIDDIVLMLDYMVLSMKKINELLG